MAKVRPRRSPHRCACSACQQHPHSGTARAHRELNRFVAILNEKQRRLFLGLLARQQGRGAIRRLARITGVSRNTIRRGVRELGQCVASGRIRRPGGGRPAAEKKGGACSLPWACCRRTPSRATRSPA